MKLVCESCGKVAEGAVRVDASGQARISCGACGAEQPLAPSPGPSSAGDDAPVVPAPAADLATEETTPAADPARPEAPLNGPVDWSDVQAHWEDEQVHQAYLGQRSDLEALADAGQHYREVIDAHPRDPVALRWRDEVLKRATALALAQLPRSRPPRETPRSFRMILIAGVLLLVGLAVVAFVQLARSFQGMRLP